MRFIKIAETYAVNADRIMDATYTTKCYEESAAGVGEHTEAAVTIRIAGANEVEVRTLAGRDAETFWSNLTGTALR
jgi:hypothetical protein